MIVLKTPAEIEVMRQGGEKLALVLRKTIAALRPGMTTAKLDEIAEREILALGGKCSFKMVPRYHWASCVTINDEVVHGIPGKKVIKKGDVVGVDVGIYYKGFHTDAAQTVRVQAKEDEFLKVGRRALKKAIEQVKPGNRIAHISMAIQEEIEKAGFSPVAALTGHGVGRRLHEDPMIPCFFDKKEDIGKSPILELGMTLAIEIIYNLRSPEVVLTEDGWTIKTKDGKISGLFEKTVAITANGPLVLT